MPITGVYDDSPTIVSVATRPLLLLIHLQDLKPTDLTEEIAKRILISLSQVHSTSRRWITENDADSCSHSRSDFDHVTPKAPCHDRSSDFPSSSHDEHSCMASIFGQLIPLLSLPNEYIRHLTSNTLVTIFECDIANENSGEEFLNLIFLCLKMAMMKAWSSTQRNISMEADISEFQASYYLLFQKLKLKSAGLLTTASIIRVLRNILKLLQLNHDGEVLKICLGYTADAISKWPMLNEACCGPNGKGLAGSVDHGFVHEVADQERAVTLFQGNILQLFCSLVDASGLSCAGAGSCGYRVICEIRDLIPGILALYVYRPGNVGDVRISEYLRHKILILMLRLSSVCDMEFSVSVSWLHHINEYFNDLLCQPIEIPESYHNTYLEGSPFQTDIIEGDAQRISSRHLQRLAVFLLLKCSLSCLTMKGKADEHIEVSRLGKSFSSDYNSNLECTRSIEGLLELHKWLRSHIPGGIEANDRLYFKICLSFSSSFLQLYMHEDDLLFQMLLQTLHIPLCSKQWGCEGLTSSAAKDDILCLVSDIFNPINLFHLFLAKILYDHQVLLDYLISNDNGARCAEYLLKCLRMVCDAWDQFMEFPMLFESLSTPCQKRRKLSAGWVLEDTCSVSDSRDNSIPLPVDVESEGGHEGGSKYGEAMTVSFVGAKDCLSSLKASISNLHHKKLFPYNPQVLLRRLSKFEEVYLKQTNTDVSSKG